MVQINAPFVNSFLIVLICCQHFIADANVNEYQHHTSLENNFNLFWTMSPDDIKLQLTYSFESSTITDCYFSIGFTTEAMIGANAVVGILNRGNISILDYYLGDKIQQDVIQSNRQHLEEKSWAIINNTLKMSFSRKLIANGAVSIASHGFTKVVYALGDIQYGTPVALKYHKFRQLTLIDFSSGIIEQTTNPWKQTHGMLMGLSFGILLPIGIIIARFGKKKNNQWFVRHRAIQSLGVFLALISWIIALNRFYSTTYKTHLILGNICMILLLQQPVNAIFRPHLPISTEMKSKFRVYWEYFHRIGYVVVLLGFVQIYIGLTILKPGGGWVILYTIIIGFLLLIFVFHELRSEIPKPEGSLGESLLAHQNTGAQYRNSQSIN